MTSTCQVLVVALYKARLTLSSSIIISVVLTASMKRSRGIPIGPKAGP
jgi:hypothetical protein